MLLWPLQRVDSFLCYFFLRCPDILLLRFLFFLLPYCWCFILSIVVVDEVGESKYMYWWSNLKIQLTRSWVIDYLSWWTSHGLSLWCFEISYSLNMMIWLILCLCVFLWKLVFYYKCLHSSGGISFSSLMFIIAWFCLTFRIGSYSLLLWCRYVSIIIWTIIIINFVIVGSFFIKLVIIVDL